MAHPSHALNARAVLGDANAAIKASTVNVEHFFAIQNLHSTATTVDISGNYLQDNGSDEQTTLTIPSGVTVYGKFDSVTPAASQPILLYF